MIDQPRLRASLIRHEGYRTTPYVDSVGKITIGVGHNLTDLGLPPALIDQLLDLDIAGAIILCGGLLPWTVDLDDVRRRAFIELAFNLGHRLLKFDQALAAGQRGDWVACAAEFKASKWHEQVGARAVELEQMLLTGTDPA